MLESGFLENRIHKLSNTSIPLWGKMDVSKMLHHCQLPIKIALQEEHPELKSNFLAKLFSSASSSIVL